MSVKDCLAAEASKSVSTELPLPSTPEEFNVCRMWFDVKVAVAYDHVHHSNYAHRGMRFTATLPKALQTSLYGMPHGTALHIPPSLPAMTTDIETEGSGAADNWPPPLEDFLVLIRSLAWKMFTSQAFERSIAGIHAGSGFAGRPISAHLRAAMPKCGKRVRIPPLLCEPFSTAEADRTHCEHVLACAIDHGIALQRDLVELLTTSTEQHPDHAEWAWAEATKARLRGDQVHWQEELQAEREDLFCERCSRSCLHPHGGHPDVSDEDPFLSEDQQSDEL